MVNIYALNVILTASSLITIGIIAAAVVGVVVVGATIGAYKGGKHAIKSRAAKKEYEAVKNSMDLVEMVKGQKNLEESVKAEAEKQEKLEAERKNNLETANQNLDVKNMQPANQEEKQNEDLNEDLKLQKIINSNSANLVTDEEFDEFNRLFGQVENEKTSDQEESENTL